MTETDARIPSRGRQIDCYLVTPDEVRPRHPAVVVIHEILGPDAHIRDVTRRFAGQGYVAAAPNLFSGDDARLLTPQNIHRALASMATVPPEVRRDPAKMAEFAAAQPVEIRPIMEVFGRVNQPTAQVGFAEDLLAVTRFLRGLPGVDPARVGSVGFCFGGSLSARLATVDPELRAAVIFYGQNPPLTDVPKIRASMLGLYASEDPGITGTVPQLAEAMRRAGLRFDYHIYSGAKHAFFNDTRPNYHRESAVDAWPRVLAFLGKELGA